MSTTMKVFGLGLSKTGTSSLGEALNLLGIPCIHYPFDDDTFRELSAGNFELSILKTSYQAIVDIPAAPYYAQWDRQYPGSKFILTVRDPQIWVKSAEKHWELMMHWWQEFPKFKRFQEFISAVVYGTVGFNADRFLFAYENHVRNVLHYFKNRSEDLLVMDICAGEAWEKLCPFLGLPIPEIAFPHANEWMHKLMEATGDLRKYVPPGASFILVDYEGFGLEFASDRQAIPFTEKDGQYWGPPADDAAAIQELERLISTHNPDFLVLGWPAFWWQDYYVEWMKKVQSTYPCLLNNDRLKIYDLRV